MINITDTHWLLACVFLEEKRVQMYDSMPNKMDDQQYWLHRIKQYLAEEYRHIYDQDLPGADEWVIRHAHSETSWPQCSVHALMTVVSICAFSWNY